MKRAQLKKILTILGLTVLHLMLTMLAFFESFARGMDRFETGPPPTILDELLSVATDVLLFPLVTLMFSLHQFLPDWFYSPMEYVAFVLNSTFWAMCIYALIIFLRRRGRKEIPATVA